MQSIKKRFSVLDADQKSSLIDRGFIVIALIFVIWQLHPSLILSNSTTTGGDTGAHFIVPWLFEHQVLTHFRLTGWSNAWYDGFPLLGFYFPLPSLLVSFLNLFVTYDVAFKLITIFGSLLLIPSLYTLGKKFGMPRPIPVALSLVGVGYLFDTSYTIDGGNLASTLAGEYSFSLSLALGIYVVAIAAKKGLTRKDLGLGALLFGLATLAHILPSFWVGAALVILVLLKRIYLKTWSDLRYTVGIVVLAGFVTAFWALPFALRISYSTSMGWSKVTSYRSTLFPHELKPWLIMALLGVIISLVRKQMLGVLMALLGVLSVAAFIFLPNSAVYNARALPFWVLSLYVLSGLFLGNAGIFAAGIFRLLSNLVKRSGRGDPKNSAVLSLVSSEAHTTAELDYSPPESLIGLELKASEVDSLLSGSGTEKIGTSEVLEPLLREPGPRGHLMIGTAVSLVVFLISGLGLFSPISWLPFHPVQSFVPSWIRWNYTGYEAKVGYPEYRRIITTMKTVGHTYGCGQSMWEYNSEENSFGTPMALMLLPYWTDGCVGSMEGLFFESSATTPFHFLNQSELSAAPSEAMAGLPYGSVNVALGVQHLQLLGVKYYMAYSPNVVAQANRDPSLQRVATVPAVDPSATNSVLGRTWSIYLVKGSTKVVPLQNLPVVLNGVKPNQGSWVTNVVSWYDNPSKWGVFPAQSGPSNWPRVPLGATNLPTVPSKSTNITNIIQRNSSVTFDVSQVNTPVLVKESYFPNWQVKGGKGPYRVAPNLMVVVPTSHHVVVYYGMTPIDYTGYAVTFLSVIVVAGLLMADQSKR